MLIEYLCCSHEGDKSDCCEVTEAKPALCVCVCGGGLRRGRYRGEKDFFSFFIFNENAHIQLSTAEDETERNISPNHSN